MKKVIVVLLLIISINTRSQKIYVQGGLNLANITTSNEGHTEKNDMLATFNVGLLGRIHLTKMISIESGLMLNGHGSKAESLADEIDPDRVYLVTSTFNPLYLELPLNLVINIPANKGPHLFVNAGPYIAIGVGGRSKVTTQGSIVGRIDWERKIDFREDELVFENDDGTYNQLKKWDYGINLGGGINFKKVLLKVSYGFGLTNINAAQSLFNTNDDNRYRTLSFSVGIPLIK